jgi:hypothetical protein
MSAAVKICSGCHEQLPADPEFFWRSRYQPDGLRKRCKACCWECPSLQRRAAENAERRVRRAGVQ